MTPFTLRRLAALVLSGAACVSAAAHAENNDCEYRTIATLPLSYTGPGLEVTTTGSINGQAAPMLVDTGAHALMLTESGAVRHGLRLQESGREVEGVGGSAPVYTTTVKEFAIGSARIGKTGLRVIGEHARSAPYDAIVGVPFLLQGDLEISLATKEIRMFKPVNCGHAFLAYWNRSASVLPFEWGFDGHRNPRFTVKINGKSLSAMIDTGASITSISRLAAKELGFRADAAHARKLDDVYGVGADATARWHAVFQHIQIGQEVIENAPLSVIDHQSSMSDIVLGTDFLRAYRVLIAMSQRKIYVSYVGGQPFRTTQTVEPWLEREAESGNGSAQLALARIYTAGEGVADPAKARAWLERAAAAGEPHALLHTGHQLALEGQFDAGAQRMRKALDKLPGTRQGALWLYLARVRSGQAELARTELAARLADDAIDLPSSPVSGLYLGKFSAEQVLESMARADTEKEMKCYVFANMLAWYEAHGIAQRPAGLAALGAQCTPAPAVPQI